MLSSRLRRRGVESEPPGVAELRVLRQTQMEYAAFAPLAPQRGYDRLDPGDRQALTVQRQPVEGDLGHGLQRRPKRGSPGVSDRASLRRVGHVHVQQGALLLGILRALERDEIFAADAEKQEPGQEQGRRRVGRTPMAWATGESE